MIPVLFATAQNPGYTRKDGTHVRPFNDRRAPAAEPAPCVKQKQPAKWGYTPKGKSAWPPSEKQTKWGSHDQSSLFAPSPRNAPPACAVTHPKPDDKGKPKLIFYPTLPSSPGSWESPADAAVFTPGAPVPASLNGIPVAPWVDTPAEDDWDFVDGQNDGINEPKFSAGVKNAASGVIVQEPDGRVWLVSPTNQYGQVMHTFPKGGREYGLSLQANAIKEAFEESGLKVEIDAHAIDIERTTSVARYYFAHRVGGSPADMGWESQAVRLVPLGQLGDFLNRPEDRQILEFLLDRQKPE